MDESDPEKEGSKKPYSITEGRALLTEAEREALRGERSENYKASVERKVVNRVHRLNGDIKFIKEHNPDIYNRMDDQEGRLGPSDDLSEVQEEIREIKQMQKKLLKQNQGGKQ